MSEQEKDSSACEPASETGAGIDRRELLRRVGQVPIAAGLALSSARLSAAQEHVHKQAAKAAKGNKAYTPKFFTAQEWATVRILADIIIPRDTRSGRATDAMVPEFMDVFMETRENMRTWMRTGLTWLDEECTKRFTKQFLDCDDAQRKAVLDDIAFPRRARPEMQNGVRFFTNFRNFTASGFWSSKMGVDDLEYMGNRPTAVWEGCPEPALNKLGVRYS